MTPMQRDLALVRYLDGASSPNEIAELNDLLMSDSEARTMLRVMATQVVGFNDLARERLTHKKRNPIHQPLRRRSWWLDRRWLAAAASLLFIISATIVWSTSSGETPISVTHVSGSVSLRASDGSHSTDLASHSTFVNGTILIEGETASLGMRLPDGSLITLNGPSELIIPRTSSEPLGLRQGSLTAEVQPQRPNQPLRFRTATAEIAVLGTHLRIDAQSTETQLAVDEGSVRFKRLADEAVVVVKQGELSSATLETQSSLVTQRFTPAPTSWTPSFSNKPTGKWHGRWLPAEGDQPARMQAEIDLSYRNKEGKPIASYPISVKGGSNGLVSIQSDSHLSMTFRSQRSEEILVLISLRKPGGAFAGNFQIKLMPKTIPVDAHGWHTWTIPLSDLTTSGWPKGSALQLGNRVGFVYVAAYSAQAKLEISALSIGPKAKP